MPARSIYAFDESHEGYADALRLLFGEVKRRWPEVNTLSVLNWVSAAVIARAPAPCARAHARTQLPAPARVASKRRRAIIVLC